MVLRGNISQEEHTRELEKQSKKNWEIRSKKTFETYQEYITGEFDDSKRDELEGSIIEGLNKLASKAVKKILYYADDSEELEEKALGDAMIAVLAKIRKDKEEGKVNPFFVPSCMEIYKNKARDARNRSKSKSTVRIKRTDLKTKEVVIEKVRITKSSLDELLPSGNGTVGDMISDPKCGGTEIESVCDADSRREFFNTAIEIFCEALMNTKAKPCNALAYTYSIVLFQLARINADEKKNKKLFKTTSSPKWAMETMRNKSIGTLSDESEKEIKEGFSNRFKWCSDLRNKLDTVILVSSGEKKRMRNVIFTQEYNEDKIGKMTDYMKKIVAKDFTILMKKDSELVDQSVEYALKISGVTFDRR